MFVRNSAWKGRYLPAGATGFNVGRGLGDILDPLFPIQTGLTILSAPIHSLPSWCSWVPFADFAPACQVPTPAELVAANASNYGPAATPETIAAGQSEAGTAVAQFASAYPEEYGQYLTASNNPYTSAVLGTGPAGQLAAGVETLAGGIPSWIWFLGAGGLAVFFLRR